MSSNSGNSIASINSITSLLPVIPALGSNFTIPLNNSPGNNDKKQKTKYEKLGSKIQHMILSYLWFKELSMLGCINRQYYNLCRGVSVHAQFC